MHKTYAAAVAGLVLFIAIAQAGCAPQIPPTAPPTDVGSPTAPPTPEATDPAPTNAASVALPATDVTAAPLADVPATDVAVAEPALTPLAEQVQATPEPSRLAIAAAPSPSAQPSPVAVAQTPAPVPDFVAVSMANDNRIAEIDPLTGKVVRVDDLSEPAGPLALAPDGHSAWVFKPQAKGSTIAVLDLLTGHKSEGVHFREADRPVAVAFSSDAAREYVATAGSIIFASSGKEYGRIAIGTQTTGVQVPRRLTSLAVVSGPDGDVLYAADQASGVVWALDGSSGAQIGAIQVGGGPVRLVPDVARQRVYALLDTTNEAAVIDASSNTVANRLNAPATPLAGAVGPDGTLYVTGGESEGEMWVIKSDASAISTRVPIGGHPVAVALSPDGKALYVTDAAAKALDIVTADTIQIVRTVELPSQPLSILTNSKTQFPATPAKAVKATPEATRTLVPTPTPLPDGALLPDNLPPGAVAEPFLPGAAEPAALAFAPDGRLSYAEQHTGKIRVVQDGVLQADPFFRLLVSDQPNAGLLGLTLDPDFSTNHYVYAFYTAPKSGGLGPNAVVRLTEVNGKGTDLHPILSKLPSEAGLNYGPIRFGPDGKLYVALPDDDKGSNAQDLSTAGGKILRVNPDGSTPTDNPFVGQAGKLDTIWAFGLHHPAGLAFQPIGHELLALDGQIGQSRDALALIARGVAVGNPLAVIKPAISPTTSTFYLGDQLPGWKNDWFYCNAGQKQLRRVRLAAESFDRIVSEEIVKLGCTNDVATGPDGALYYSDAQGIYRIRMPSADVLASPKS